MLDIATGKRLRTVMVALPGAGARANLLAEEERASRAVVLSEPPFGPLVARGYVSVLDAHSGQPGHARPSQGPSTR